MSTNNTQSEIVYDKLEAHHLRSIYTLSKQMASVGDEETILETILDKLILETGAEVGAFVLYDREQGLFVPRTIKTSSGTTSEDVEFSQTVFKEVFEKKEAVLSFDTRSDYSGTRSVMINKIHAILAFPLIINNEVYGILYFDSRRNRQSFNESARQFLSFFAVIASLALEQILLKKKYESENVRLRNQLEHDVKIPFIIGESDVMKKLFRLVAKVADSNASVIITGENGTGKDLVARAIHDLSPRKDKPFIAQYIGNIPATILESELFGYKKGAFTGATADRIGLFEAAEGGTLFLDEIGDLTTDLQAKMLRVLQNREFKRLGENIIRRVDVRILAATNKDLATMVRKGEFREDLYYRLNVVGIEVPTLRARKSDIPLLVDHFLKQQNPDMPMRIEAEAMKMLSAYSWPGNVRQLENMIKRASIMAVENRISRDDIQFDEVHNDPLDEYFGGTMEEFKNLIIQKRIEQFDGNKTRAAKSLDISLRSLQTRAKELGL